MRFDRFRCVLATLVIAGCSLAMGCGGGVEWAPVEGTVTDNGRPAAGIQVTFEPLAGKLGQIATGVTDEAGRYRLAGPDGQPDGAIVGPNRVTLNVYMEDSGDELTALPKSTVPLRFRDGSTVKEVPPAGIEAADFAY
ncbi:MAG: hypothetical protein AAGJ46_01735 [Planctomycetota bacterium]